MTRILLRDLITRLAQAEPGEIYVEVEELEPDVFIVPFSVLPELAKVGGSFHSLSDPPSHWPGGIYSAIKRKGLCDASNAGSITMHIFPAANSPIWIDTISVEHDDGTSRVVSMQLETSGEDKPYVLISATKSSGSEAAWGAGEGEGPLPVYPEFSVQLSVAAVAATKAAYFFVQYRYIGTAPTITEVGPTGVGWSDVS